MPDDTTQKRRHIRYTDPESRPIKLKYRWAGGQETTFFALITNESYSGLGCIYIGQKPCEVGDTIVWIESEDIETSCHIVRSHQIENNIYFLALNISGVSP